MAIPGGKNADHAHQAGRECWATCGNNATESFAGPGLAFCPPGAGRAVPPASCQQPREWTIGELESVRSVCQISRKKTKEEQKKRYPGGQQPQNPYTIAWKAPQFPSSGQHKKKLEPPVGGWLEVVDVGGRLVDSNALEE